MPTDGQRGADQPHRSPGRLTPGFAAAWPSGPYPGTSSVNFAAGQNIAATTVVGCGANATIQVLSNTVTDFMIDVIGYYQ